MSFITSTVPYDCDSHYGERDDDIEVLPCVEDGPSWHLISLEILFGLFVWLCVVGVSWFSEKVYSAARETQPEGAPPPLFRRYVGTATREPEEPMLGYIFEFVQLGASGVIVWTWIGATYRMQGPVDGGTFTAELLAVCACVVHRFFVAARHGFSLGHAMGTSCLLDCLTLPAVAMRGSKDLQFVGGTWLTLAYLRTYHQLNAVRRMRDLKLLESLFSDFAQACLIALMECVLVVFTIAGTTWLLESMGDIDGFADKFIASGMGEISFFQMVYYTFITISTVGYGDFSPTTVPSRIFVVFSIFAGVGFFSYMSSHIMGLLEMEASGRGKFRPKKEKGGRGHILVFGGGVTSGSATVIETFLRSLCRDGCPEIVLMSQAGCSHAVLKMLKEPWTQEFRIKFFVGSPLDKVDMQRVRASESSICFILADFETADTVAEDQRNQMIAASLSRNYPDLSYRLMLVGLPAEQLASQIGLSEYNTFSIEALKASFMGSTVRVPGFSTMVLNMALPDLPDPDSGYKVGLKAGEDCSRWLHEYINGSNLEPYGFLPKLSLVGKSFKEAAVTLAKETGLLLIAAQFDGGIVVNPSDRFVSGTTVLFALADTAEQCNQAAAGGTSEVMSWEPTFSNNRKKGSFGTNQRKKTVRKYDATVIEQVHAASLKEEGVAGSSLAVGFNGTGGGGSQKDDGKAAPAAAAAPPKSSSFGPPVIGGIQAARHDKAAKHSNPTSGMTAAQAVAMRQGGSGGDEAPAAGLSPAEQSAAEAKAARCLEVVRGGGHIVVAMMEDSDNFDQQTVWEQLEVVVATANSKVPGSGDDGEDLTPVVVVHTRSATSTRKSFIASRPGGKESILGADHVYFVVGNPMVNRVLQAAGLDTASRLLTIAPSAPPPEITPLGQPLLARSNAALDESNLMFIMVVEMHLGTWGRGDLVAQYDLYATESLALCPPADYSFASPRAGDVPFANAEPRTHPRYAAGRVLPKPTIAGLYSMAYYTPGVLELFEAMINPVKYDQVAVPWSLAVPKRLVGEPYSALAMEILESGAIPMGLLRAGGGDSGTPLPYVVTAIPSMTELAIGRGDLVYCLADRAWAKVHGLYGAKATAMAAHSGLDAPAAHSSFMADLPDSPPSSPGLRSPLMKSLLDPPPPAKSMPAKSAKVAPL